VSLAYSVWQSQHVSDCGQRAKARALRQRNVSSVSQDSRAAGYNQLAARTFKRTSQQRRSLAGDLDSLEGPSQWKLCVDHSVRSWQLTLRFGVLDLSQDRVHSILSEVGNQVIKTREHHNSVALSYRPLRDDEAKPEFTATHLIPYSVHDGTPSIVSASDRGIWNWRRTPFPANRTFMIKDGPLLI
jgi:hypothetical protein